MPLSQNADFSLLGRYEPVHTAYADTSRCALKFMCFAHSDSIENDIMDEWTEEIDKKTGAAFYYNSECQSNLSHAMPY